jgi:hypothetical protein
MTFARRQTGQPSSYSCAAPPTGRSARASTQRRIRRCGTPRAEREIVYVVETERGQETLTPAEMAKKYGWKNDPAKVRLTP